MRSSTATLLLAWGTAACASTRPPEPEIVPRYERFFLVAPSHAAGYETEGVAASPAGVAVARAQILLRDALVESGFVLVATESDAEGILELTMGGIGEEGDAERLFVALRDAESGRLVAIFRAHTRVDPRDVEELVTPLAEVMDQMVRALRRRP